MPTQIYTHACTRIHTHAHARAHTHTHTHTQHTHTFFWRTANCLNCTGIIIVFFNTLYKTESQRIKHAHTQHQRDNISKLTVPLSWAVPTGGGSHSNSLPCDTYGLWASSTVTKHHSVNYLYPVYAGEKADVENYGSTYLHIIYIVHQQLKWLHYNTYTHAYT